MQEKIHTHVHILILKSSNESKFVLKHNYSFVDLNIFPLLLYNETMLYEKLTRTGTPRATHLFFHVTPGS